MIGVPIATGLVSEVLPIAPRPGVPAPLVMERVLPAQRTPLVLAAVLRLRDLGAALPAPWQRLVDAEVSDGDVHLVYERFVGLTYRDLCAALRATERVLPLDVLRAAVEALLDALAAVDRLPPQPEFVPAMPSWLPLGEESLGFGVDLRWRFAPQGLNHWLDGVLPDALVNDPEYDGSSPVIVGYLSPEALHGRAETPASTASRAGLLAWQLAAGGYHPFRGGRQPLFSALTRYAQGQVRLPLTVHPLLPPALRAVLQQAIAFTAPRFADVAAFRAALDSAWPEPAASPERIAQVLFGLGWRSVEKALAELKRAPMLPIRWDGVWAAARTPEEGVAVLEDQLLERLASPLLLPARGPLPDLDAAPPVLEPPRSVAQLPFEPAAPAPDATPEAARPGLLARLLAFLRA